MRERQVVSVMAARPAVDGAGVQIQRSVGAGSMGSLDPFLMLDEIRSDDAADYMAGFPSHPHRGFETVTYVLEGRLLHEDHLGNRGVLDDGGVQWMTAGRGIIHSEMPEEVNGRMHGFQLWINLPARQKMCPPAYRDLAAADIPVYPTAGGGRVKVIAGALSVDDTHVEGPVQGGATEAHLFDVVLAPDEPLVVPLPAAHRALAYAYAGDARLGPLPSSRDLSRGHLGVLGDGDRISIRAGDGGARLLILAGRPLNEPVVQYGPFVMNTREEIDAALRDYRDGTLAI